jgi:hypothetical protein
MEVQSGVSTWHDVRTRTASDCDNGIRRHQSRISEPWPRQRRGVHEDVGECTNIWPPNDSIWPSMILVATRQSPAHAACTNMICANFNVLNWPAHNPYFSPIEMVWALTRRKLRGLWFVNGDALFAAIFHIWEEIPRDVVNNLCWSFPARCQVCVELSGGSLNGHWRKVHRVHHELDRENVPPESTIADE